MSPTSGSRDRRRDAPFGWITGIPPNLPINKGTACDIYLLEYGDLGDREEVWYDDCIVGERYYCKEYKERDVEWKAWGIHGGPIGYWHFLKKQTQEKRLRSNLLPYDYRRGARYDLSLSAPPELQDRYVCDSIVLRDAKHALPTWIWNACNEVLDGAFLDGRIPLSPKDLTSDREDAMKLAVSFFRAQHQLYAGRPDRTLGSSPCMTTLRIVLLDAPTAPKCGSEKWGNTSQGLVFIRTERFEFYIWDAEYLERVFTAARGVVEQLGPSAAGWDSARWEIYAKYSQLPGIALRYDQKEKRWWDHAVDWLDAKISSEKLKGHLRGQCPAGIAFNTLLPVAPPSSSSSAQGAAQASSSAGSPVHSPSTAKSSA